MWSGRQLTNVSMAPAVYLQGRHSTLTAAFFKNVDDRSQNYTALYPKQCSLTFIATVISDHKKE
jgi:hypothetical protein